MCERAYRNVLHFHNLTLPFLSIICRYFRYFVSTNDMLVGLHVPPNSEFPIATHPIWLYGSASMCERAERASLDFFFCILTAISFNILSVLHILCRYKWHAGRLLYVRSSGASELRICFASKLFAFSQSKTAIPFNILSVLRILCRYKWHAGRLTCTDQTQK